MTEFLFTYLYIVHNSICSQVFERVAHFYLKLMTREVTKSKSFRVDSLVLQVFERFNW